MTLSIIKYIETKNMKYFEAAQKAWISMEKNVNTALCDFIPFVYASALCGCFMPWLIPLYAICVGKCFMPGSVRDGLTSKLKGKEKRNHEDLCKAA